MLRSLPLNHLAPLADRPKAPALALALDRATWLFSLDRLHHTSRNHLARSLILAACRHTRNATLSRPNLPNHHTARLLGAATQRSAALLLAYAIPPRTLLTDHATSYYVAHRTNIPLTFLHDPSKLRTCSPSCRRHGTSHVGSTAIGPSHASHAHHQSTCGVDPLRFKRHEDICKVIADYLAREGISSVLKGAKLSSSLLRQTRVDAVLTIIWHDPPEIHVDVTVSNTLSSTYVADAAKSAEAVLEARHREKRAKHVKEHGAILDDTTYTTATFSTLGDFGPAPFRELLRSIYSRAVAEEIATGGTGALAMHRAAEFHCALLAALLNSTSAAIIQRVEVKPAPSPTASSQVRRFQAHHVAARTTAAAAMTAAALPAPPSDAPLVDAQPAEPSDPEEPAASASPSSGDSSHSDGASIDTVPRRAPRP